MLRALALMLLLALPLWGVRKYQETDDDATGSTCTATEVAACGSVTEGATSEGRISYDSGTPGISTLSYQMADGDPPELCFWFVSDDVNDTSWAAGDWVVRINLATTDPQTWLETRVCRMSADCSTVLATVGTNTATTHDLDVSTGVFAVTVSGAAQAGAGATDIWVASLVCREDQDHGNSSPVITPDQLIDTPLDALPATGGPFVLSSF